MPTTQLKSFLMLCTLLVVFLISHNTHSATKPVEIRVGIYAPFSGSSAFIGRSMLAAMEMGSDELTTSPVHYNFYTLDKVAAEQSAPALERFINAQHLDVLLTEGSVTGLQAAPLAKKHKLIHFSMASDASIADGRNNFLAWTPADEQAQVLVHALQQKKVQQLAILSTSEHSDRILTDSVIHRLPADHSIKLSVHEQFAAGTKDFSPLVNKIKATPADIYLIMAPAKDIDGIKQQLAKAQINKPITTIVDRVTAKTLSVLDGQWYVDTAEMDSEFVQHYQEAYLNYPVAEAGYAFDVFHMVHQSLVLSMKETPSFVAHKVAEHIQLMAVGQGVMGTFNLNKQGVLYTQSQVKTINNGVVATA